VTHSSITLETGKSLQPSTGNVLRPSRSSDLSTSSEANKAATVWVDRQLNPHRAAAITQHSGQSFLDVGCGNGRYVLHFSEEHKTSGIDIQPYPSWDEAPRKFQVADAANLPFEDGSVETIVSFETLEHVPNPEAVLREFHRVCRRNIIVSVPNCELPPSLEASRLAFYHYTDRSHVNFFTRELLATTLRKTGFDPQEMELINACPAEPLLNELFRLPPLLIRLIGRLVKKNAFQMTILVTANRKQASVS